MTASTHQSLSEQSLKIAFIEQLTILHNAKKSLLDNLPELIEQATFKNLKLAIEEDLEDAVRQMATLKEIFRQLGESWLTHKCLAIDQVIREAFEQVSFQENEHYESDMSVLFYLSAIDNMQLGACKVLNLLAKRIAYQPYAQLVLECLDVSRDSSRLINFVAIEYFSG